MKIVIRFPPRSGISTSTEMNHSQPFHLDNRQSDDSTLAAESRRNPHFSDKAAREGEFLALLSSLNPA